MKYVAGFALLLMALSIPGVNFYHHLVLPEIYFDKVETKIGYNTTYPFIHYNKDITLTDGIDSHSILYFNIVQALRNAVKGDTITFHLAGYGGDVQTTTILIDNIKTTKAKTVMVIEGPVYSAHAYIALSGDVVEIKPYAFVMLHSNSILSVDCSTATGTDRGVSNVEHCNMMKDALMTSNVKLLIDLKYVTNEEKLNILMGHDVYLQSDEINYRINKE